MKKLILSCIAVSVLLCNAPFSPAADVNEEETTEKFIGKAEEKAYKKVETLREHKRYKTKLLLSASQGYDTNVFLDPQRRHDTFSEFIIDGSISYPMNGRWDFYFEAAAHDVTYWEATQANLIDTDLIMGFEGRLPWGITAKAYNDIELLEYQNNDDGEYVGDKAGLLIKQKLPNNYFHSFQYEYFYKNYSDRKAFNGWGGLSDSDRADHRNTFDYSVGLYMQKSMVKVFGEYFLNSSNDSFLDYYDYESIKLGSSAIYLLTDKLSAYASFYKQFRHYSGRTIPDDDTAKEKDRGWVAAASLYYDITKSATLGLNYSYRQNKSNNPSQKYSGSLTSMGFYYRF
ncbi:MAG TPA: hypothetical protein PLV09_02510 [Candidatus Omnitrophota bacterium]|nr:hypothetical protein [Candidatus Omnitrophota bacterium]MDD5269659.1 hypothetical protein [Candidatus Omnitrophota bacterium]MDD5737029.1 hypothetical protein [Candidatus Omnitrophota bacterium]HOX10100.1 hypothetical protein [Candidatus Omnitrophota bacterium]HPN66270.1 hypothetical protein [Candidatus Omnitrophota bacterium]